MNEDVQAIREEPLRHEKAIKLSEPLAKINKQVTTAVGVAIFVAVTNMAIGILATWVPAVAGIIGNGIVLLVVGLVYFGVALGIGRKSRAAAIVGLGFLVLETLATIAFLVGSGRFSTSALIMRFFALYAMIAGLTASTKYRKLKAEYGEDEDLAVRGLFIQPPVGASKGKVAACGALFLAGLFSFVWALFAPAPGLNPDQWERFTFPTGQITLLAPGEMLPSGYHNPPQVYGYEGGGDNIYVNIFMLPDMADSLEREKMETFLRQSLETDATYPVKLLPDMEASGDFGGAPYFQAGGYDAENKVVAAGRAFLAGDNFYYALLMVAGKPGDKDVQKAVDAFFQSIELA